jgi:tRNA A-37 threonylcarbamoyl transferase component Bud32
MKILALDPSLNLLKLLSDNLEQYNYDFRGAVDIEVGLKVLQMGYEPEIIMVNTCFCVHPTISQLEEFFRTLTYPYKAIIALIDVDSEANRTYAINMGFHGVISKPLNLKQVLTEIESTAGLSAEQFTFLPVDRYPRREVRLPIAVEVTLKITEENNDKTFLEQTITEDISLSGAAVLTLFDLEIGTVINISPSQEKSFCVAIVRRTVVGNDYIRRLNLEIIGESWKYFYNELTQIHATNEAINKKPKAHHEPTKKIHLQDITLEESPSDEIPLEEILAEEIPSEELEPLEINPFELVNNRYKMEQELGKGGLGIVYQAIDLTNGKKVALKFLINDQSIEDSITNQKYFEREIKILSQIQHPNIVSILDSGFSINRPFFVMDYIEGESLDKLLQKEKIWSVPRVLNLLQQICPALSAMHSKNIIHRDLKPGNIIIEKIGNTEKAVLLDLGIAKMVSGSKENSLMKDITKTGTIVGTVGYTSPEQCMDAELDDGVDIYSLGIIVYQLLTGEMPFKGNTIAEIILAHVQGKPTEPRQFNPNISNSIESIVLWAIAKNRNQRPTTIMDFLKHFEEAALENSSEIEQVEHIEYMEDIETEGIDIENTDIENTNQTTEDENPMVFFLSQD